MKKKRLSIPYRCSLTSCLANDFATLPLQIHAGFLGITVQCSRRANWQRPRIWQSCALYDLLCQACAAHSRGFWVAAGFWHRGILHPVRSKSWDSHRQTQHGSKATAWTQKKKKNTFQWNTNQTPDWTRNGFWSWAEFWKPRPSWPFVAPAVPERLSLNRRRVPKRNGIKWLPRRENWRVFFVFFLLQSLRHQGLASFFSHLKRISNKRTGLSKLQDKVWDSKGYSHETRVYVWVCVCVSAEQTNKKESTSSGLHFFMLSFGRF